MTWENGHNSNTPYVMDIALLEGLKAFNAAAPELPNNIKLRQMFHAIKLVRARAILWDDPASLSETQNTECERRMDITEARALLAERIEIKSYKEGWFKAFEFLKANPGFFEVMDDLDTFESNSRLRMFKQDENGNIVTADGKREGATGATVLQVGEVEHLAPGETP